MHKQAPVISAACPRCGKPTVWALQHHSTFDAVAVLRAGCGCWLARDQWVDLAERANTLLDPPEGLAG